MEHNKFREKKKIAEESASKDILLKQLEIVHRRELEFGRYIMITKGWAVTLFLATITFLYKDTIPDEMNLCTLIFIIVIFALLWAIDALMGAYQRPYYKAIMGIEDELVKKEQERDLIFLTYENGKADSIVWRNFRSCLFHVSVFPFYSIPIIIVIFHWIFSKKSEIATINGNLQDWTSIVAAISLIGVLVNICIACFIYRQVKAADLSNKKSVVPVMGITLKPDEKKEPTDILMVYIRNNIALNIECNIFVNGEHILGPPKGKWPSAIPYLRVDSLLSICEIPIENYISDKKTVFKARFTYESILKDKYSCIYSLSVWKDSNGLLKKEEKLESWTFPWDC